VLSTAAVTGAAADVTNAVTVVTSTTYTLLLTDNNKLIRCANAATITVTLPASFPAGWACSAVRWGAGNIKFVTASGAELRSADTHNGTRALYSAVSLSVAENAGGNAAQYVLSGDTATVA
jgi:hypothetical protein